MYQALSTFVIKLISISEPTATLRASCNMTRSGVVHLRCGHVEGRRDLAKISNDSNVTAKMGFCALQQAGCCASYIVSIVEGNEQRILVTSNSTGVVCLKWPELCYFW